VTLAGCAQQVLDPDKPEGLMYKKDSAGKILWLGVFFVENGSPNLPQPGGSLTQTVTVLVNGAKQVQSITIDPEVVSKDDVGMLQDLIVAAINDAHRKADEAMAQRMGGMLPPGMKLPGM
jgi:DNA-binding YbaB/EbfC family protein